jgi:putative transposase
MGQSLVQNYLHITFSTKYRQPLIYEPFEQRLHAYLGKTCNELQSQVIAVGGFTDHVHILCMLSKNISLAELVKKVKGSSSKWIKTLDVKLKQFYWQDGYGAFSVNPRDIAKVVNYINNQQEHHTKKSFKDEYLALLLKNEVDYDERYVWD